MVRKPVDSDEDVSLFPFLSVLACIIGTLTLIIAAQAISQLDNKTVEAAEEYEKAKKQVNSAEIEVEKLNLEYQLKQKSLSDMNKQEQEKLNKLRERLRLLAQQLSKETDKQYETKIITLPKVEIRKQREELEGLQKQLKSVQEEVAQLEKQIEDRKLPPEESQVSILPTGSGVGYAPYFVECDAGRIIVHASPKNYSVRVPEISTHVQYQTMLKEVTNEPKAMLIFLVRDDGLSTYYSVRNQANEMGINNGKIPVIGQGRIDLSYFTNKKK